MESHQAECFMLTVAGKERNPTESAENQSIAELISKESCTEERIAAPKSFLSEELCKLSLEESAIANKVKQLRRSNERLKKQLWIHKQPSDSPPPCPPVSDAEENDLEISSVLCRNRFNGCTVQSVQIKQDILTTQMMSVSSNTQTSSGDLKVPEEDVPHGTQTANTDSHCQSKLKIGRAHKNSRESSDEDLLFDNTKQLKSKRCPKVCQRRSADARLNHLLHVTQLQNSQIERLMMKATESRKYKRKTSKLQQRNKSLLAKLDRREGRVKLQSEVISLLKKEFYHVLRKVDKIQVMLGKQQVLSNGECDVISRFVMARHCHVRDKLNDIYASVAHDDNSAAAVTHDGMLPNYSEKNVDLSLKTPHLSALLEQSLSATDRNHQPPGFSGQRRLSETTTQVRNQQDEVTEEEFTDLPSLWEEPAV